MSDLLRIFRILRHNLTLWVRFIRSPQFFMCYLFLCVIYEYEDDLIRIYKVLKNIRVMAI